MWQIIRDLVSDGVTVFLTTQYLEEADELADRIAVLDGGKVVAEGTPEELKRLVPGGHVRLAFADTVSMHNAGRALGASAGAEGLTLQVPSDGSLRSLKALLIRLDDESIEVEGLAIHSPGPGRRLPRPHRPIRKGARTMTALSYAVNDSATMLRRNLKRMVRYPSNPPPRHLHRVRNGTFVPPARHLRR